jgi:hypothetical protein
MAPQHQRWGSKDKELRRQQIDLELQKNEIEYYDGQTAESGYNQVIFDLLKDPVSLGMPGSNNNRGHQR